jgi:hypothetical protein
MSLLEKYNNSNKSKEKKGSNKINWKRVLKLEVWNKKDNLNKKLKAKEGII